MKLKAPFETSFGTYRTGEFSWLKLWPTAPADWGEVTAAETPAYNAETTDTAWQ